MLHSADQLGHTDTDPDEQHAHGCPQHQNLAEGTSTGFLPISIAAVLLLCAWWFGLLG